MKYCTMYEIRDVIFRATYLACRTEIVPAGLERGPFLQGACRGEADRGIYSSDTGLVLAGSRGSLKSNNYIIS